jgi:hypothetical protein
LDAPTDLKPDFIFPTGDYVERNRGFKPALGILAKLDARGGVWVAMWERLSSRDDPG